MTKEDIKVGQTYTWISTPMYSFTIVEFSGNNITWKCNFGNLTSGGYHYENLICAVIEGDAVLVSPLSPVKYIKKLAIL